MEKIICGQSIKKGQIVEITVPNIEHPIKAVVLDIIEYYIGSNNSHYECTIRDTLEKKLHNYLLNKAQEFADKVLKNA